MNQFKRLIDKLETTSYLTKEEWVMLIENRNVEISEYLFEKARKWQHKYYDNKIYTREDIDNILSG